MTLLHDWSTWYVYVYMYVYIYAHTHNIHVRMCTHSMQVSQSKICTRKQIA